MNKIFVALLSFSVALGWFAYSSPASAKVVVTNEIQVSQPADGSQVPSTFNLSASAPSCDSHSTVSMGYSFDNSTDTEVVYKDDLNAQVTGPTGQHVLHIKCWGKDGIAGVKNLNLTIGNSPVLTSGNPGGGRGGNPGNGNGGNGNGNGGNNDGSGGSGNGGNSNSLIPSNAQTTADIQNLNTWIWKHDPGTPGTSSGIMNAFVQNPSLNNDGTARELSATYASHGGEISSVVFNHGTTATHFVYDTYIYIPSQSQNQIENIEMDINHVLANGQTVILASQCAQASGTFEYSYVDAKGTHWKASNIPCQPQSWAPNTWHHVQIATEHDAQGNVTYDWVSIDGKVSYFGQQGQGIKVYEAEALGWKKGDMQLQFQLDGASAKGGSMQAYIDKMQVWYW